MTRKITQMMVRIGLAIWAAVLVFPAQTPAVSVHASAIDIGDLMAKALNNVHSFMMVTDSITKPAPTSPGGVMKMHVEEIFIHRGSGYVLSMQMMIDGKFSSEVYTGTHVCLKHTAAEAWNCTYPPSYAKLSLASMDPVKVFKASGIVTTSRGAAGTKSIKGQSCTGYRFAMSMSSIHLTGYGTIWFSSDNGRVVQLDETSTVALVAGSPPMVTTGTSSYSRWDDASLRIPAVPVS